MGFSSDYLLLLLLYVCMHVCVQCDFSCLYYAFARFRVSELFRDRLPSVTLSFIQLIFLLHLAKHFINDMNNSVKERLLYA